MVRNHTLYIGLHQCAFKYQLESATEICRRQIWNLTWTSHNTCFWKSISQKKDPLRQVSKILTTYKLEDASKAALWVSHTAVHSWVTSWAFSVLTLAHIIKYTDGWNKLGNFLKGLASQGNSSVLWQMRSSGEAASLDLKTPVCPSHPLPALLCVSGDWSSQICKTSWFYKGHWMITHSLSITPEPAMLILPRYLEGNRFPLWIFVTWDAWTLKVKSTAKKHVFSDWQHLRFNQGKAQMIKTETRYLHYWPRHPAIWWQG